MNTLRTTRSRSRENGQGREIVHCCVGGVGGVCNGQGVTCLSALVHGTGQSTVDVGDGVFETTGSVVEEVVLQTGQDLHGNGVLCLDVLAAGIVGD